VIILKPFLSESHYENFVYLCVAMRILHSESYCRTHIEYARELLSCFVDNSIELYGRHFVTYNAHMLLHLVDNVLKHGVLSRFSAYPFENNMGVLKKRVNGPSKPIVQLAKRLGEMEKLCSKKQIDSRPKKGDCFQVGTNKCIIVQSINQEEIVLGDVHRFTGDLFKSPCASSLVGIYTTSTREADTCSRAIPLIELGAKMLLIKMSWMESGNQEAVAITLLHST
jgi:hypothetical protein